MSTTDILVQSLDHCECCSLKNIGLALAILIPLLIIIKQYFNGGVFQIPHVDLNGKFAVVTGGNSGIGANTAKQLAKLGCEVLIGARSKQTAEEVIKEIKRQTPTAKVDFVQLDLASKESIESFAKSVSFDKIDYLVNNAGVMAIPQRKLTKEGIEMQWGVNHLGHFYLTYLLWNKISKSDFFRIVNVSSLAHKKLLGFGGQPKPDWNNINFEKDYQPNIAYSRSKLYNVLFTQALASKIGTKGITASLHPGVVRTELMRQMTSDGIKGTILKVLLFIAYPLWWLFSKNSVQGSQTSLYTLLGSDVENGGYYTDCKKSWKNSQVTEQNWTKLWTISEQTLGIKFNL